LRSAVRFQDYASPTMRLLLLLITLHLCTSICYCLVVPKPLCGLKQQQFAFHTASTLRAGASIDPMLRDAAVSALVASESFVWLKLWGALASSGVLDSKLTRKIIHTGSAPLFIAHWPLYSSAPSAKYLAVAVPLLQTIRFVYRSFLLVVCFTAHRFMGRLCVAGFRADEADQPQGTRKPRNELVNAVSRTGSKTEALGGPLIYSVVLLLGTLFFFRYLLLSCYITFTNTNHQTLTPLQGLAGGNSGNLSDGRRRRCCRYNWAVRVLPHIAVIVYSSPPPFRLNRCRKYGTIKWPFAAQKSIAGSCAFVVGGFLVTTALLWLMSTTGIFVLRGQCLTIAVVLLSVPKRRIVDAVQLSNMHNAQCAPQAR
jgi:dolichol kinase